MPFNPGEDLSSEERRFCKYRAFWPKLARAEAYRLAYRQEYGDDAGGTRIVVKAQNLEKSPRIRNYIEYLKDSNDSDLARDSLLSVLDDPTISASARTSAASALQRMAERAEAAEGFGRWAALMREVSAEVVKPVELGQVTVSVRLEDLIDGRAYLNLPFDAAIRILQRAGAPWNVEDPEASLSDLQRELLGRTERTIICHGGSGVGKSVLGGCFGVLFGSIPNARIAVIAGTYDHCASEFEYIYTGMRNLYGQDDHCFERCVFFNKVQHHDMEIRTIWNSHIKAFSTDHKDGAQILGKEFDLVILGEGSHVTPDIYQRKILRALNRRVKTRRGNFGKWFRKTGRSVMFTTPDGYEGCASAEWDRAMVATNNKPEKLHDGWHDNWLETVYLREAECIENPSYSTLAFEAAKKTLPPDIFAEQFQGKRVRRSGLIYKEFDAERHVKPMPSIDALRDMKFSVGIDTGKHFSASLNGLDPEGCAWRLLEVTSVEQRIDDNCTELAHAIENVLGPAFNDEKFEQLKDHIELWNIDPRSQHKQEIMSILNVPLSDADLTVQGSIDQLRTLMSEDRFFVVRDTNHDPLAGVGFLFEISRYAWQVVKEGLSAASAKLEPRKVNDHSMDEARYGVVPLLELGPPRIDRTMPMTFAENWERQVGLRGLASHMRNMMANRQFSRNIYEAYKNVHDV